MIQIELSINGELLQRIRNVIERRGNSKVTEEDMAEEVLNIGLNALESTLDELDAAVSTGNMGPPT